MRLHTQRLNISANTNREIRIADGRWTVDRPDIRVDPIRILAVPFDGTRIQRERISKQDIDEFGATVGCLVCNANNRQQLCAITLRLLQSAN